jgi:transcriptional regulator with GAF, ATPase, and Fis domain
LANGGTIFLDEIGELPPDVQVRLLRVLQTKEFERVGGNKTIHSDFRLITATNRNLKERIKNEDFRTDLYYRLNVFPINIPPLRERKEDISQLTYFFIKIYSTKMGKDFSTIPEKEMGKLTRYDWPGNVRELENVIERSVILSESGSFRAELGGASSYPNKANKSSTLREIEREQIIIALHRTGWKVRGLGGAAELLDVHPSTLRFKMKKHGIQRPPGIPKRRTCTETGVLQ